MVRVGDVHDLFKTLRGGEHHRVRNSERHRLQGAEGEPLGCLALPQRLPKKDDAQWRKHIVLTGKSPADGGVQVSYKDIIRMQRGQ